MIKKTIMCLLLFLTFGISLSFISVSAFAEDIESKATVRIIQDDTIEPEKSNTKLNKKNRLPQTNEHIDSSISILGLLVLLLGVVGIYINNKRNGEIKNEKN